MKINGLEQRVVEVEGSFLIGAERGVERNAYKDLILKQIRREEKEGEGLASAEPQIDHEEKVGGNFSADRRGRRWNVLLRS